MMSHSWRRVQVQSESDSRPEQHLTYTSNGQALVDTAVAASVLVYTREAPEEEAGGYAAHFMVSGHGTQADRVMAGVAMLSYLQDLGLLEEVMQTFALHTAMGALGGEAGAAAQEN